MPGDRDLSRTLGFDLHPLPATPRGVILSERVAEELRLEPGMTVEVELLARDRRTAHVTVAALARSNYRRAEKLVRAKSMSISQFEHAYSEFQLKSAEVASTSAAIDLRKAELASAEARLQQPGRADPSEPGNGCCVNITAPIHGVVLKVLARSEQAVSPGTRIAEVGNPGNLEIVVDLLSADAARIEPGAFDRR